MKKIPTILAIDYGTKRIGLAISRGILTEPLKILNNDDISQAIQEIKEVSQDEGVERIIVGMSEAEMAQITQKFIDQLEKDLDLKIETVDETLSSQEVQIKLKEAGIRLKDDKKIDHYAAAVILENWMADQKYTLSEEEENQDDQDAQGQSCSDSNPNINPCANCPMAGRCGK